MLFDQEYVTDPALSNSDLSLFERDIRKFYNFKILGLEKEDTRTNAMDIGNIVDAIFLKPEELKRYYVVTDFKAKGKVKDVVEMTVDLYRLAMQGEYPAEARDIIYKDEILKLPDWPKDSTQLVQWFKDEQDELRATKFSKLAESITNAISSLDYQSNWKPETRINKILDEGKEYVSQLVEANGRIMIHTEQWNKAHQKKNAVNEDEYTKATFDNIFEERKGVIVHKQLDLYGTFEDVAQKGRLDLVIKREEAKIIEPWDVKTAASHAQFLKNYRAKKYGRQAAYYTELCRQNYPGYIIDTFRFLVIPIDTDELPEIYEMSPEEIYINTNGYTFDSGYHLKGWKELIHEIEWHKQSGKWDHRKEYYLKGKNIINSKAIVQNDLMDIAETVELV